MFKIVSALIAFLFGLSLAASLPSASAAPPLPADHCVYSGGGWLCAGGDPTDPLHLNDPDEGGRIAGDSRYATAAAISAAFWTPGEASTVYLANGVSMVDAVAAGASVDGPVLLVGNGADVPAVTLAEIARLAPVDVVALGGPTAVTDAQLAAAVAAGQ